MSFLSKIFGGGLKGVLDGADNIISKFKLSPNEKNQFKLEMEALLQRQESELEETYRKELGAKAEVMKAELAQGDNYTKRARPSVVYAGLFFIFLVYVFLPLITYISGNSQPEITLPEEFWWAWGSVVSVYGIGRTVEKAGVRNKVTNAITGSGAVKVDQERPVG